MFWLSMRSAGPQRPWMAAMSALKAGSVPEREMIVRAVPNVGSALSICGTLVAAPSPTIVAATATVNMPA